MRPSKLPPISNGGEERALDALLVGLADMDERVRQQAPDGIGPFFFSAGVSNPRLTVAFGGVDCVISVFASVRRMAKRC